MAEFSCFGAGHLCLAFRFGVGIRVRAFAGVAHAIKAGLCTPATSDEIHRAVFAEIEIRQIERLAFDKHFVIRPVTCAVRNQMNGKYPAIRPVKRKERATIFRREIASGAEFDTSW